MSCLHNSSNLRAKLIIKCTLANHSKSLCRLKLKAFNRLMASIEQQKQEKQQKQQALDKQADQVYIDFLGPN